MIGEIEIISFQSNDQCLLSKHWLTCQVHIWDKAEWICLHKSPKVAFLRLGENWTMVVSDWMTELDSILAYWHSKQSPPTECDTWENNVCLLKIWPYWLSINWSDTQRNERVSERTQQKFDAGEVFAQARERSWFCGSKFKKIM